MEKILNERTIKSQGYWQTSGDGMRSFCWPLGAVKLSYGD